MDLKARYGLTAASLKARLDFLDLRDPVDEEGIDKLDALDEHLRSGGQLGTFHFTPRATVEVMKRSGLVRRPHTGPMAVIGGDEVDLDQLERIYNFLEKAATNEWHLPTSAIKSLLGATPKGRIWKRFGFEFIPATKHGVEKAWAVRHAGWDFE